MPRHLARSRTHFVGKKVAVLVFDEVLLDLHRESWALVDFAAGRSEFERYTRLSSSGRNVLPLTHQLNDLHLVLDLGGSRVLSFRFPQGGCNLFFEALRVFETH